MPKARSSNNCRCTTILVSRVQIRVVCMTHTTCISLNWKVLYELSMNLCFQRFNCFAKRCGAFLSFVSLSSNPVRLKLFFSSMTYPLFCKGCQLRTQYLLRLNDLQDKAIGWGHLQNKRPRMMRQQPSLAQHCGDVPHLWALPLVDHKAENYHEPKHRILGVGGRVLMSTYRPKICPTLKEQV